MSRNRENLNSTRHGLTLVELLVVVAMLIILVSVLTAAMQPVLAGKEVREAARGLNAFIAGSVARAAESGRPVGVWIQRAANSNAAFDVFLASVPPLYAGDSVGSSAYMDDPPAPPAPIPPPTVIRFTGGGVNVSLIQPGDSIRLNYQGPWYTITTVNPGSVVISLAGKPNPLYYQVPGVPFQIRRQPRKSAVSPLQLPSNTVIDLSNSGVGTDMRFASAASQPVVIMFNADGSTEKIYYHDGTTWGPHTVLGSIHLLVGRPDKMGGANLGSVDPDGPGPETIGPNENRWISISYQTGRVITTENMGVDITTARQFARTGEGMGGG